MESNMEVDDATFEDALESISEAPETGAEETPKEVEVDKDMSTDEPEQVKSPENAPADVQADVQGDEQVEEDETNKDNGEQPHAMEIHDVPEHDQDSHTDDPNASVAPSEKSMDVTLLNNSAIDPFDQVKHTSDDTKHDESVTEKDTSEVVSESEHEPANDDAQEIQDSVSPAADDSEQKDRDEVEQDKEDEDNQKEPEEVPDGDDTEPRETEEGDQDKDDDGNAKDTEEVAEDAVEEIGDGENENVSLLPDSDREISEADKERARLARAESEKEKADEEEPADEGEQEEPTVDLTDDAEPAEHIFYVLDKLAPCFQCKETKACQYRLKENDEPVFFCEQACVDAFIASKPNKYVVRRKKYVAEENTSTDEAICNQCDEAKVCKYVVQQEDEKIFLCEDECLNLLVSEQADRIRVKRVIVRDLPRQEVEVDPEANKFNARTEEEAEVARVEREQSFVRRCAHCLSEIQLDQKTLNWEAMDFCNEPCLGQYQNFIGATCTACHNAVPLPSLGKYCVRFGFEIRQFCRSECLTEYKKGVKVCSYCQMDIGADEPGFLAPVGEKGQFKDFCTQICMKRYEEATTPPAKRRVHNAICAVCQVEKPARIQVVLDNKELNFCTNPCLSAFKFVNNVVTDQCGLCCKQFERRGQETFTLYPGTTESVVFCTKICMNIYITLNRKIVPCSWCKVKKYDFDMIRKILSNVMMCSLNCVTICEMSVNAMHQKRVKCDQCKTMKQSQYHLTMSDASIRNFCTYQCVMSFQSQFNNRPLTLEEPGRMNDPVPTGLPKRVKKNLNYEPPEGLIKQSRTKRATVPVIASVQSLAKRGKQNGTSLLLEALPSDRSSVYKPRYEMPPPPPEPEKQKRINLIVTPAPEPQIANKILQTKPATETKAVSCRPAQSSVELQTCKKLERKRTIPIPVPVYVPIPVGLYNIDIPIPVPVPLTIPVPIFVPTNRNSAAGILKEIKKIHEKMPSDPLEAELLMMADFVSGRKCDDDSESDSEEDDGTGGMYNTQTAFSEDLVQIALKMATNEYEENNVDLENEMTANTITHQPTQVYEDPAILQHQQLLMMEQQRQMQTSGRGRKRGAGANRNTQNTRAPPAKRIKSEPVHHIPQPEPPREPEIKPDANMCLKYTFGVNAWKQWVLTKNAELEKSGTKRRPFKNEILQMTADELNYSLCLFVKEVRKPNGSEYAPDTIYYLVLGIQQYLYENGRIDNIFTDPYYERFTDCLDEVARKFSVLYNDSQYIVTRVEEEHLWECKQLGAHSPHVLLSTLMFFNTKHFNLVTPEEHQELSFSHIMKHWKRNPGQGGKGQGHIQGTRNVMLRFYPPQSSLAANSRKKKVYEQSENEENPLRCPVKLYEFYLSKCPESVKTRNDVFYLQPERSCVPDSPVWYSTQPMPKEGICKMLHRVKMVKEINIALLTTASNTRVPSQIQSRGASRTQTSFLQQFSLSRNYGDAPPRPQEPRVQGRLPPLPLITGVRSLATFTKGKGGKGKAYKGVPCPEIRVLLDTLPPLPSTRVVIGENGEFLPPRPPPPRVEYETRVVQLPREIKEMSNMSTQCDVLTEDQEVNVKPDLEDQELQTEADLEEVKTCIVPVPIFIPTPIRSFAIPRPVPKPFYFPIPVPVFIPITKSTANSVMKLVNKHKKVDVAPADPFEAELLMMAEAVAGAEGTKKPDESSSTTVDDNNFDNQPFNEDLVQMALKMASNDYDMNSYGQQEYGRKRPQLAPVKAPSKRIKSEPVHHMPMAEPPRQPAEKPDANMCLKYTFGVNAWKQWVVTKNAELEKSSFRRKPFKTEILQMTADELNYSLCLFVKEVRKPNGSEYAPDTIYYLVLGIQQYLYENGRIDNIFTDIYYEKFTDCLDEVAKKFSVLYNDSQYIVTRVEEEHLWECKQLGAHSPHVLLSTLMFFNTKFFNLVTAEEHIDLSFSHIMKHWKRNPGQGGKGAGTGGNQGSRNVLLRYYPPQASLAANARKKKVYEQQENEENPLRCPVKLYEFYLSKCPESVKTRNDVFYLQPERSCVPDSPVWYSTQPLNRHSLAKMLHRVKMVKEINIALLTS